MRKLIIATFALSLMGQASLATAAVANSTCSASLKSLTDDWNARGFSSPSKPAQALVTGLQGSQITGGQFEYVISQIRSASQDCQAGREEAALRRIENVRKVLSKPRAGARSAFPYPENKATS